MQSAIILAATIITLRPAYASTVVRSGVAVYGDVILDFNLGLEKQGSAISALSDCSTMALYCMNGTFVQLEVASRCADNISQGQRFGVGKTPTTVRDEYQLRGERLYILTKIGRLGVAYIYAPHRGILGIVSQTDDSGNLEKLIDSGGPRIDIYRDTVVPSGIRFYPHVTLEGVAVCR